jgi:WD40 repeat protein
MADNGRTSVNQHNLSNPTLFDLLARSWQCPSSVTGVLFNADDSVLAISQADGTIALARVADGEPPRARMHTSADFGQTTIRPRTAPPVPLVQVPTATKMSSIAAYQNSDFVLGMTNGDVVRLTVDGSIAETLFNTVEPVLSIHHCRVTGGSVAIDRRHMFVKLRGADLVKIGDIAGLPLELVSMSKDGSLVAVAADDQLSIRRMTDPAVSLRSIALPSRPLAIRWNHDGGWLACGLASGGFCLLDLTGDRSGIVADFPGPVQTICWSTAPIAVVASGAFRIAAWSMDAPPLSGDNAGALLTGRAGFLAVDMVATHPKRNLVAAGYANGRLVVSPVGSPAELLLRQSGGALTALAWSANGQHLAIGDADGNVAIITFPTQLFK